MTGLTLLAPWIAGLMTLAGVAAALAFEAHVTGGAR
jgi:hypothetical protein